MLVPEAFAQQSVGVQGFPALERLLFSDDSLVALQNEPYRCQTVQAISRNLDDIASGVAQRWRDEFRTTVANADERGIFESAEDATIDYLKAVVESVRRIHARERSGEGPGCRECSDGGLRSCFGLPRRVRRPRCAAHGVFGGPGV